MKHFLLTVFALSFSFQTQASTDQKITFCFPRGTEELMTLEVLLANEKGYFKKQGIEINFKGIKGRANILMAVANNQESHCDMGASNIDGLYREELDLNLILPVHFFFYGLDYDTHLVTSKKSNIKTIADLKGKTVRLGQAPGQIAFKHMLAEAGLKQSDVKIVLHQKAVQIADQLENGKMDAGIAWVPVMPVLIAEGNINIIEKNVMGRYVMPILPHSFSFVNYEFSKNNPEIVKKFKNAIKEATDFTKANPSELIYTFQRNTKLIGSPDWKVSRVVAERAGELFTGPQAFELADQLTPTNGKSKTSVIQCLNDLGKIFFKEGIKSKKATDKDFTTWLKTMDKLAKK
ncbi:MAG: ABC transporter substrate-binding protein [Bacteriovorax sp.]|nr:ABC transporter substrate-binding protein [Bacteriovorax sp.]